MRKIVWKVIRWTVWGLFVLQDVLEVPESWVSVRAILAMLPDNFATYAFAVVLGAGFLAIDLGPYARRKWKVFRGRALDFVCHNDFPCGQIEILIDAQKNYIFRQTRLIGVTNNSGKTLKSVRVRLEAMYPEENPLLSSNPNLPAALRPHKSTETDSLDLHSGETEYWDVAKLFENETKADQSGIFICAFDKNKRDYSARGMYKAVVAVYAEETEAHSEEFALGTGRHKRLLMLPWREWSANKAEILERQYAKTPAVVERIEGDEEPGVLLEEPPIGG